LHNPLANGKQWRIPEEMSQTLLTNMKQGSEEIHFLRYKIIGAQKKFKNWPLPLFRPRTDHACPQKRNPSRETVPLNICIYFFVLFSIFSEVKDWRRFITSCLAADKEYFHPNTTVLCNFAFTR
jgi:hypothetical protein